MQKFASIAGYGHTEAVDDRLGSLLSALPIIPNEIHPEVPFAPDMDQKRAQRRRKYGLTPEDFFRILREQNYLCACCQKKALDEESACVDHDHATGRIRGILCSSCNVGIGLLGDDVAGIRKALDYLESGG